MKYGVWRYTPMFSEDGYTEDGVCFRNVTEEHAQKYAGMDPPKGLEPAIYFFAELGVPND